MTYLQGLSKTIYKGIVVLIALQTSFSTGGYPHVYAVHAPGIDAQLLVSNAVQYQQEHGINKLKQAYVSLLEKEAIEKQPYARKVLKQFRMGLERRYPTLVALQQDNHSTGKTFLMADGTVFSQSKSTIPQRPTKPSVTTPKHKLTSELYEPAYVKTVEKSYAGTTTASPNIADASVVETPNIYVMNNATIDIKQVQLAWQGRVNELRAERNLQTLTFNKTLHKTAAEWANTIRKKRSADHKRTPHSAYYDYTEITNRFSKRGVEFEIVNRTTYTENIGWAGFYCSQGDCTQEAITSLRRTFDYFRNEEGQAYDLHRKTMIQPFFKVVGIGISVDEADNKIYIAAHYAVGLK